MASSCVNLQRPRFSLSLKIVLAVVIATFLPIIVAMELSSRLVTSALEAEASRRLASDLEITLNTFSHLSREVQTTASLTAQLPEVLRALGHHDEQALRRLLLQTGKLMHGSMVVAIDRQQRALVGYNPRLGLLHKQLDAYLDNISGLPLALAGKSVTGFSSLNSGELAIHGLAPVIASDGDVMGAILVQRVLNQTFVERLKAMTNLEIGIAAGDSRSRRWVAHTFHDEHGRPIELDPMPVEIIQALRLADHSGYERQTVYVRDVPYFAAYAPLRGDYGEFVGSLFVGEPQGRLLQTARDIHTYLGAIAGASFLLAGVIVMFLSMRVIRRLRHFVNRAAQIAAGDLDQRVEEGGNDELAILATAINQMSEAIMRMQVRDREANPLTMLPGNNAITEAIRRRLKAGEPLAVLYTDIDHFKPYNDVYGYEQGNMVIRKTAEILQDIQRTMGPDTFIGHIGGDDFILLTRPDRADDICQELIRQFDAAIPFHYSYKHQQTRTIVTQNRQGVLQEFPLCSISIAVVTNELRTFNDPLEIAAVAAEVKHLAKCRVGSAYVKDRRSDSRPAPAEQSAISSQQSAPAATAEQPALTVTWLTPEN